MNSGVLQDGVVVGCPVILVSSHEVFLGGIIVHGSQAVDEEGVDTSLDGGGISIGPDCKCIENVGENAFSNVGRKWLETETGSCLREICLGIILAAVANPCHGCDGMMRNDDVWQNL